MSFPTYPDYKDSGVEWLGKVPSHWNIKRFKYIFEERNERSQHGDETLLSVSAYTGVRPRSEIRSDDEHLSRAESLEGYKICYREDLVMNIMLAWNRGLGFTNFNGIVSPAYCVFRHVGECSVRFLDYLVRSDDYIGYFKCFSRGVINSRLRLYPEDFGGLFAALPDREEQSLIAAFLDHETAKIDALIAEQETLIELLKEKRQAVISHAVTKGLDPTVPIKDSGVEWLGDVPEHWLVLQLGRVCNNISDGPHFSPNYVDDGVLFISARNIKVDGWSFDDAKYISEEDYRDFCKRITPEYGDVLYTKGGTTGVARVVDFEETFQVWVHVAVLKISTNISNPYFLAYALNSSGCYEQSQLHTRGATNKDLGLTRMIKIWLALPPMNEQDAIITYLNGETTKIDTLIAEAQRTTELLHERRSALISAAVTGRIDVRGYAPQPEAA
ncbi:restriction endonuclease subunit S [Nitratidesulfovibrio liaohensis]|uniref:restriction endonuclease subunit S n=1 Tax=Nitratidesulfovibrio liaohensis TaxID=2604158 RepID=UPI001421AF97|nr:restriction endonuclease subunit S [Nitratidesulfovibrio liaohensis]NHZ47482.1 restriction endonuclease subunit S [Nitratidesulfovibrio liaohensis]